MKRSAGVVSLVLFAACTALPACSALPAYPGEPPMPVADDDGGERAMAEARAAVPSSPAMAEPEEGEARAVWQAALDARGARVVVSREARALWLVNDDGVALRAPVAVGKHETFEYAGRRYDFRTPIMQRKVLGKGTEPLWVPPDWHYFEIAADQGLEPVHLKKGARIVLSDSTVIEVRGDEVGRVNRFGNFWPFTPGTEIIFDEKIFIPPFGTSQRRIPEVLGTHKLELGDGYLIHGTNVNGSIGEAVSHGCVRMFNEDVARLYALVPVGTPVYVY